MNLTKTSKILIRNTLLFALAELVIGSLILFRGNYLVGYILGILFGSATSVIKTIYIEKSSIKLLDMESKQAQKSYRVGYFIRFGLTIAVLLVFAMNHPVLNLYACALGLLNQRFAGYTFKFFMNKQEDLNEME